MEISVIPKLIPVTRNRKQIVLMTLLILFLLFSGKMPVTALPGKKLNVGIEEILKFKTGIIKEALQKTGFSVHFLKKNETIYRLGRNYYVSVESLMKLNQITNPRLISVGKKLYIPPVDYSSGQLKRYRVKSGDTLDKLLSRFGLELWQFKRINPGLATNSLEEGTYLFLPRNEANRLSRTGMQISLIRPVWGRITSRFGRRWGRMHTGIDMAAPKGTPVRTAASGRVVFSGWNGGYGWFVKIDHGKYHTNYGHLSKIIVRNGSYVRVGDLIGLVGATGRAFGSHLHFELEINGKKIDPYFYLR